MALALSCAFATSNMSHEHARIAESLGYARAWFYDSPALYPDVWAQLCRAAEKTSRIGPARPIEVPYVIAAAGPKGIAAAHEFGDGVFSSRMAIPGFRWNVALTTGTVLEEGE